MDEPDKFKEAVMPLLGFVGLMLVLVFIGRMLAGPSDRALGTKSEQEVLEQEPRVSKEHASRILMGKAGEGLGTGEGRKPDDPTQDDPPQFDVPKSKWDVPKFPSNE